MVETKGGAWKSIVIPIFPTGVEPRGGNVKVVYKSGSIKNDAGLRQLAGQPALTGVIVNDVDNLGFDQKLKLSEQYTFADVGSALILADRSYPTAMRCRRAAIGRRLPGTKGKSAAIIIINGQAPIKRTGSRFPMR